MGTRHRPHLPMTTLHLLPTPATGRPRSRLPLPLAFAVVAAIDAIAFYASATPSPLYGLYQSRWHFSTPVLTLVYATYAVGVLVALLLVGGISDQAGRRPVLALSLVGLLASMGLFIGAGSVGWLFAARAVQGVATGATLGAAGAALLEFHPTGDARRVALVTGAVNLSGLGVGALLSSLVVDLLPAPRVVPYIVVTAAILLLLALIPTLPEPVAEPQRPRLRPQRPGVPHAIRWPFPTDREVHGHQGPGGKSGGRAVKVVDLTSGDLRRVSGSEIERSVRIEDRGAGVSRGQIRRSALRRRPGRWQDARTWRPRIGHAAENPFVWPLG